MLSTLREYPHFVHFIGLIALAAWYAGVFPRARAQPRFLPLMLYSVVTCAFEGARWALPAIGGDAVAISWRWQLAVGSVALACAAWAISVARRSPTEQWPIKLRVTLVVHLLLTYVATYWENSSSANQLAEINLSALAATAVLTFYISSSLPLARRAGARLHWSMVLAVVTATAVGYLVLRNSVHNALQRTEGSLMERSLSIASALDPIEVDALFDRPAAPSERLVESLARVRAANPDVLRIDLHAASVPVAPKSLPSALVRRRVQRVSEGTLEFTLVEDLGYLYALARVRGIDRIGAVLIVQLDRGRRDNAVRQASLNAHFAILFISTVVLGCIAGYQRVVRLVDRRSSLLDATANVSARLSGGEDPVDTARWLTSFLHERLDIVRADVWVAERREGRLGFVIAATSPSSQPLREWVACNQLPENWHIALCSGQALESELPPHLPAGLETTRSARRVFAEPITGGPQPWGAIVIFGRHRVSPETTGLRNALRTLSTSFSAALVRRERTNLLRAAEERFRLILDTSIDGFWDIDFSTGECYHSPRWWDMLGYKPGDLPDDLKTTRELIHPMDLAPITTSAVQHLPPGVRPLQHQIRVRHRDGRWIWVEASAVEVRMAAGPAQRALGFDRDITERRLANERLHEALSSAEQANRTKSEFLAAMSHELRTPLNTVIGLSSLLRRSALSPRQAEWVEATQLSAEQLLALINDLLDLSKIEAGRLELKTSVFELRTTVDRVLSLFAKESGDKSVPLDCVLRAPLGPIWVSGDELRFRQVLTNLTANAIKFTASGRVWVEIYPGEGSLWHFAVHDTGPGIPEEKLGQLFQRFSQLDATNVNRVGTGLGLAISRELVVQMGGEIGVESTVGQGSVFRFQLPFIAAQGPARRESDRPDFSGYSVVVWEPHPIDSATVEAFFHGTGAELQPCHDETVLADDLVRRPECIAVVIPRAFVPERRAVAQRLRQTFRDSTRVRVIGLHVKADEAMADPDFDGLLPSPVRQRALFELVLGRTTNRSSPAARHLAPLKVEGILVAEDHPSNRLVMQAMLSSLNCQAHYVEDGSLAIEAMRERPFTCALVDIGMPVVDGVGVARWVRDHWDLPWPRPRLIAVTAFAGRDDRQRFLDAGMDAVLNKPFTREELYAVLAPVQASGASPETQAAASAEEPANDDVAWDRLEALMETTNARRNAAIFRRIVANFREQAAQEIAELAGLPDEDPVAAKRALHRFKGALSSLSLQAAARQVSDAHEAGVLPPLAARAEWIETLRATIDRSLLEIHARYPWLEKDEV